MLLRYSLRIQEPNARRDDDLGLDLPLTMVQEHVYRESASKSLAVGQFDLMHCSQILFLNKNDLFEKKVMHSDIRNFFPVCALPIHVCGRVLSCPQDYDGPTADPTAGRDYFKKRFARLAQKANQKEREVYIQCVVCSCMHTSFRIPFVLMCSYTSTTTATDTEMLRVVMAAVEGARVP